MTRYRRIVALGLVAGFGSPGATGWAEGAPPPPPPAETLTVHGQKRFLAAPVPNQQIHDPADVMRDPSTGAPMSRFGGSYIDANPVPPINPGLQGDQSPVQVGAQH